MNALNVLYTLPSIFLVNARDGGGPGPTAKVLGYAKLAGLPEECGLADNLSKCKKRQVKYMQLISTRRQPLPSPPAPFPLQGLTVRPLYLLNL